MPCQTTTAPVPVHRAPCPGGRTLPMKISYTRRMDRFTQHETILGYSMSSGNNSSSSRGTRTFKVRPLVRTSEAASGARTSIHSAPMPPSVGRTKQSSLSQDNKEDHRARLRVVKILVLQKKKEKPIFKQRKAVPVDIFLLLLSDRGRFHHTVPSKRNVVHKRKLRARRPHEFLKIL